MVTNLAPYEFISLVDEKIDPASFAEMEPPPRVWTEDEVNAIRTEAEATGRVQAMEEARASNEARIAAALETLTSHMGEVKSGLNSVRESIAHDATYLARAIALKIAGEALQSDPIATITPMLETTLTEISEPIRLQITVHDDLVEGIDAQMDELADFIGFEGTFQVRGGATHVSDCHCKWKSGGVARDHQALVETIDQRINAFGHEPALVNSDHHQNSATQAQTTNPPKPEPMPGQPPRINEVENGQ